MNVLILIGERRGEKGERVLENLYTGLDGVALQAAADKAAETKGYIAIGKVMNPFVTPMAIDPAKTQCSTPTFPRPKEVASVKKVAPAPKHIQEQEDALAKLRAERLKVAQNPDAGKVPVKAESSEPAPKADAPSQAPKYPPQKKK